MTAPDANLEGTIGHVRKKPSRERLALVPVTVYKTGWVMAPLFFGTWLFPLGYLA